MGLKLNLGLIVVVITGAAATLVVQHQAQAKLREQMLSLREQVAELQAENQSLLNRIAQTKRAQPSRLPAPPAQIAPPAPAPTEALEATNFFAQFGKEPPKLTTEQVEAYLKTNGRNASGLLAAYRTGGNPALLTEAMQNYPSDPRVAFEAVFKKDLSPELRRQWLNTFEQTAPNNALANYLSAREYFKVGQTDQAVQQLVAASGKSQFQDYTLDRRQDDEEAYLAAGYPIGAAKMIASGQVELPQLSELKQLGLQMVELSKSYSSVGDQASAQAVLQMAVNLGKGYGAGDCAISHLVGMVIERNALNSLDPNGPYGADGQTVQDRLNQLSQQKAAIKALFDQGNPLLETMSERDWVTYIDRDKTYGEEAAMRWALAKFGQK
jgi:hypothetical protein